MKYHNFKTVVPVLQNEPEENSDSITSKLNVHRSTSPPVREITDSPPILRILYSCSHKIKASFNHVVVVCDIVRLPKKDKSKP